MSIEITTDFIYAVKTSFVVLGIGGGIALMSYLAVKFAPAKLKEFLF